MRDSLAFQRWQPRKRRKNVSACGDSPVLFPPCLHVQVTRPAFVWEKPEVIQRISKQFVLTDFWVTSNMADVNGWWYEMRQFFRRFSSYIAMSSYEVKHNVKGREFFVALDKGLSICSFKRLRVHRHMSFLVNQGPVLKRVLCLPCLHLRSRFQ